MTKTIQRMGITQVGTTPIKQSTMPKCRFALPETLVTDPM